MSNNREQPKTENLNNQFSNTEPLTHAQRVAIANTMSNNKQSSLDFYRKNLHAMVSGGSTEFKREVELFEQAKAMHKEEMEHFFKRGMFLVEGRLWKPIDKFEEYYNETFGGNNEHTATRS